ncbi:hypothetical protein ACLOJK_033217 [Asimina triloba]
MAQFRQSGGERASGRVNGSNVAEQISSLGVRSAYKQGRIRRSGRSDTGRKVFVGASVLFISVILIATVFFLNLLSDDKDYQELFVQRQILLQAYVGLWTKTKAEGCSSDEACYKLSGSKARMLCSLYNNDTYQDDGKNNSQASLSSQSRRKVFRVLKFGKGSVALGRDSRYWDKDDRRRDGRYTESSSAKVGDHDGMKGKNGRSGSKQFPSRDAIGRSNNKQGDNQRSRGLYNEAGREELKHYEAEYEASTKHSEKSIEKNEQHAVSHSANDSQTEHLDFESENDDDGIDYHDAPMENSAIARHDDLGDSDNLIGPFRNSSFLRKSKVTGEIFSKTLKKSSSLLSETIASQKSESKSDDVIDRQSTKPSLPGKKLDSRKGIKRHKFSGKFSYTEVENRPNASEGWEPRFAGHQSLHEREESFYARDQMINCGFIRGSNKSLSTGFDLAEDDVRLRTPNNKVSRISRKNVCFVMFMEESTLQMLSSEGQKPDRMGFIGLWKIVVVKNLPYTDMRRVGKIPKLLAHRLFPSARYSIWLDSKLRLQSDPLLILEYFLWRRGYEYAISNHYDRHCLWEEVMQNKRLNKQANGVDFTGYDMLEHNRDCERRSIVKLFRHRAEEKQNVWVLTNGCLAC